MKKIVKIVFSRYAVSLLLLLFEFVFLSVLLFHYYTYSWIFAIFAGIVNLVAFVSLVVRDTNPEFKLTWLAAVFLFPIVGGFLYMAFYNRRLRPSEIKFLSAMKLELLDSKRSSGDCDRSLKNLDALSKISKSASGKALSILHDDDLASLYYGDKLSYFGSGDELFLKMCEDLMSAERFIFLEYFIIEDGVMWQSLLSILRDRRAAGVEIRILYDDIGSMKTLPDNFLNTMRKMGISCLPYGRITLRFKYSHNNRDHRKICVIDGRIAFTGGVNLADEYINKKVRFGVWKDGGIRVEGDAALGFCRMFLSLYDLTDRRMSKYDDYLSSNERSGTELQLPSVCREKFSGSGFVIPFGSGPSPAYSSPVGKNLIMNIINMSERYLYVTTPYLIMDYDLTEAFRAAAARGVDVRIITPMIPDKKIIKIMTKSSYPYLILGGVRIFEYTPGFIHEKMIISDDSYAVIGTINLDYRSLVHHFEDGLWIYSSPVIYDIRDSFMRTESSSVEILEEDAKLNVFERIVRNAVKIFAPLL